jgi:hypothetical protein
LKACGHRIEWTAKRILEISIYWNVWNVTRLMLFAFAPDISEQDAFQVLPGGICLIMETQLLSGRVWEEDALAVLAGFSDQPGTWES